MSRALMHARASADRDVLCPVSSMLYGPDLSYIHHTGFSAFAEQAAAVLVAMLRAAGIDIVDLACGSGMSRHLIRR